MKSKSKDNEEKTVETKTAEVYETKRLLKSSALKSYQPDFAKVILTDPAYTIEEAIDLLNKKLKEEA